MEHPWDEKPAVVPQQANEMTEGVEAPEWDLFGCIEQSLERPEDIIETCLVDKDLLNKSEDPFLMPNTLSTIDEEISIVSDGSGQPFGKVPEIFSPSKEGGLHSKKRRSQCKTKQTPKSAQNAVKRKQKRRPLLVRRSIRVQKQGEKSISHTPFASNVHGMPFYSVLGILKDLETLDPTAGEESMHAKKAGEKTQNVRLLSKFKNAFLGHKKGRKSPNTYRDLDVEASKKDGVQTQTKSHHFFRFPFVCRRPTSSVVSKNEVFEAPATSPACRWNTLHVLHSKRFWRKCFKAKKQPLEQSAPTLDLVQQESIDKIATETHELKPSTRIIIVSNRSNRGNESSASFGSDLVHHQPTFKLEETVGFCDGFKVEFAANEPYSIGSDLIAFLSDSLIDLTHAIGGKLEQSCGADAEAVPNGPVSLILVGSSAGELTGISHTIRKVDGPEETKHGE